MEAKAVQGRREGALFSVFLDWCYGHKGLCTPFLFPGGKYGLSTPSSPTFAWSLAPDGNVEGGRESASGKREQQGGKKWGVQELSLGHSTPKNPGTHQVLPTKCSHPIHSFQLPLGPFRAKRMDFTSLLRSGLLPPALPKF